MSPSVGFAQNQGKSCASQVYSDFPNTLSGCSSSLFWRSRSHFLRALRRVPSLRARRIAAIRQARRPSPMLRPSSPNPILPPCSLNQTLQPRRQTTTSAQAGPQIVINIDKVPAADDRLCRRSREIRLASINRSTRVFNSFGNLYSYFYE